MGTESGQLLFWNARRGVEEAQPLQVSTGNVLQISFSPDGTTMVASSHDGSTTLWDLRSRTQIGASFPERPDDSEPQVFESNGKLLIEYLADAAQWPMKVSAWEQFACQSRGAI